MTDDERLSASHRSEDDRHATDHGRITIARPPDVVFDTVADQTLEPSYNPRMLSSGRLTTGPLGWGTRFEGVARSGGREVQMTVGILEYERPRRLRTRTRMLGAEVDGTLTCRPVPAGTDLARDWDLALSGRGAARCWVRWRGDGSAPGAMCLVGPAEPPRCSADVGRARDDREGVSGAGRGAAW
jgi:uncharacterized protein YndB with AHSA1/START domain